MYINEKYGEFCRYQSLLIIREEFTTQNNSVNSSGIKIFAFICKTTLYKVRTERNIAALLILRFLNSLFIIFNKSPPSV